MNTYFTTKQAALYLGLTPGRVRQLIKAGVILSEKRGRDHSIPGTEVRRFHQVRRSFLAQPIGARAQATQRSKKKP